MRYLQNANVKESMLDYNSLIISIAIFKAEASTQHKTLVHYSETCTFIKIKYFIIVDLDS